MVAKLRLLPAMTDAILTCAPEGQGGRGLTRRPCAYACDVAREREGEGGVELKTKCGKCVRSGSEADLRFEMQGCGSDQSMACASPTTAQHSTREIGPRMGRDTIWSPPGVLGSFAAEGMSKQRAEDDTEGCVILGHRLTNPV